MYLHIFAFPIINYVVPSVLRNTTPSASPTNAIIRSVSLENNALNVSIVGIGSRALAND